MPGEWLSLSEAAEVLGVHPSTVRNWADQGRLPVHRTHGGHRRFRRAEVELCQDSQGANGIESFQQAVHNALKRTRMQVSESRMEGEAWYKKLDDEARQQYRHSGRLLLQGLISSIGTDGDEANIEARALGYEYASRGQRYDLSLSEASHAFLFFRNLLLDSLLLHYENAAVRSPQAYTDMIRKVTAFTDQILITLLETYQATYKQAK